MNKSPTIIKFEGKHFSRLLNELYRKKIPLGNVHSDKDSITMTVPYDKVKLCEAMATEYDLVFSVIATKGVLGGVKFCKWHAGLIVGVILAIILIGVISQFVLKIDIKCDNDIYKSEIEQLLKHNNINIFSPKSVCKSDEIERMLVENITEISFASVYLSGIALKIDVVSFIPPDTPTVTDRIVSEFDGIITRILVSSGTALVKPDDRVMKGDELIGAYHIIDNDKYDDVIDGEKVPVEAKGEVYARVFYSTRLYIPDEALVSERTGRKKIVKDISIGRWNIGKKSVSPYERYESVVSIEYFFAVIPIKVVTTTFYEINDICVEHEVYAQEMIRKAKADLFESIPKGAQILKEYTIDKGETGNRLIDIYYEVEQRIDNGGQKY